MLQTEELSVFDTLTNQIIDSLKVTAKNGIDKWRIKIEKTYRYFTKKDIDTCLIRKKIEETPIETLQKRNNVEATIFQLGFHYPNAKSRYRGLIKLQMWANIRCLWVNFVRIVKYMKQLCPKYHFFAKYQIKALFCQLYLAVKVYLKAILPNNKRTSEKCLWLTIGKLGLSEWTQMYNYQIQGFRNYYAIANNSALLNSFKYIMEYSMYKTFAGKYKTSAKKILRKYKKDKVFTIYYSNKKGELRTQTLYNKGFKRCKSIVDKQLDDITTINYITSTSLIDRLKAQRCEICGATENLEMHHVRKLKDLDGKRFLDKMMIARRRKTLAPCRSCHLKVHTGKI